MTSITHCFLCVTFFCGLLSAQDKPFSKIYFIYEAKTNYIEDKKGFYADKETMIDDFPTLKYVLKKSPTDSTKMMAYAAYRDMTSEEERRFYGSMAHSDEVMEGVYDVKSNITEIKHKRTRMKFKFTTRIDYNKNKVYVDYPAVSYDFDLKPVTFADSEKLTGFFQDRGAEWILTTLLYFDQSLDPKICANIGLGNNVFGLKKAVTSYRTIELKSVTYKE